MRRGKRFIARQWELPLIEERRPKPLTLPARGSLLRISGAPGNCNGLWRVQSALRIGSDGIFLGLEEPAFRVKLPAVTSEQGELFC